MAEPDLCSDDPSRKLVRQVFGAISEYERSMIVLKLRAPRQRVRRRDGKCEGRTRFGDYPKHREEKEVIEKIKNLSAKGLNYSQIADKLNSDKVPTRNTAETVEKEKQQVGGAYRKPKEQLESKWYPATVSRIVARTNAD